MYCSACAKEIVSGLIFCNHCGSRLSEAKSEAKKSDLSSNALISAIVSIFVIGFGCIVAILAIMKNLGFRDDLIGVIVSFSFITILLIETMFMWLLIKHNQNPKEPKNGARLTEKPVKEIYTAPGNLLSESKFQPASSVTEHTTRTLEPISRNE